MEGATVTAGVRADAHRVQRLATDSFDSRAKRYVRWCALTFLSKSTAGGTVLDLWGGGTSAKEAVAMGMNVLSIDDGRWLKTTFGITSSRSKRALMVAANEGGYAWGFGRAKRFASQCNGAFYDFCGHWCPDVRMTLAASRHMDAIVITLMPERVAVGKRLTIDEWRAVYTSLLKLVLPEHGIRFFRKYRRDGNQWAFCIALMRRESKARAIEYHRRKTKSPEARARDNELNRARRKTPEYRAMALARYHERYDNDPEFRARQQARARGRRDENREAQRRRYAQIKADPAKYAAEMKRQKFYRERRKTAVSGTAAEAIEKAA